MGGSSTYQRKPSERSQFPTSAASSFKSGENGREIGSTQGTGVPLEMAAQVKMGPDNTQVLRLSKVSEGGRSGSEGAKTGGMQAEEFCANVGGEVSLTDLATVLAPKYDKIAKRLGHAEAVGIDQKLLQERKSGPPGATRHPEISN